MKILGVYQIEYIDKMIIQTKNLISHTDYVEDIKPSYIEIDFYEMKKETAHLAKKIKRRLKDTYGEHFFTNESPLFNSITTGILDMWNNEITRVHVKQINTI